MLEVTPQFLFEDVPQRLASPVVASVTMGTRRLGLKVSAAWDPGRKKDSPYVDAKPGGAFGFEITLRGVQGGAGPRCEFVLSRGRCEDETQAREQRCEVSMHGAHNSANFAGTLALQGGVLRMSGHVSVWYERWKEAPVELAVPVDFSHIDWREYEFSSLDETLGCQVEQVRRLSMPDAPFERFPERLLALTALEELTLQRPTWPGPNWDPAPLAELPDLSRYPGLKRLHLAGTRLSEVPESIGALRELQSFALNHSLVETVPAALFQLPKLNFVFLSKNRLTSLPEVETAPVALRTLEVTGNQLKRLPEALIQGPELRYLYIDDNPWESLPAKVGEVEDLRLAYEDRVRLLDMSYRGADRQGTVPWNDERFYVRQYPELRAKFLADARAAGEGAAAEALLRVAKRSVRLQHGDPDDYTERGNTRFGGLPDLPAELPYPHTEGDESTAFQFIAQLDCAALASLQDYLPRTGFLYFFLSDIELLQPKVLYWDGPRETLRCGRDVEVTYHEYADHDAPYDAYKAVVASAVSLPSTYGHGNDFQFEGGAESLLRDDTPLSNLLERDAFSLEGHHDINTYVFTQHEAPTKQAAMAKRGRPQDWMVLLKVASQGDFQWWDAGELFFVIHKSDLQKRNFSNVYCGLESS